MRRTRKPAAKPVVLDHAAFDAHCYVTAPSGHKWRILRGGYTTNAIPGLVIYPHGKMPFHRCVWIHELVRGVFCPHG